MFLDTVFFLFRTLTDLFLLIILLRFYLQVVRASFQHPIAQFVMSLTNFAVLPLRRVIPSVRGFDTASLVFALFVALISKGVLLWFSAYPFDFAAPNTWVSLMFLACLELIRASIHLLIGCVIMRALLSWFNPYNPITPILNALTDPFLIPFKRMTISGIDLSPFVLLLILQVILMLPINWLEQTLFNLLMLTI